jgi:hypothetical protein
MESSSCRVPRPAIILALAAVFLTAPLHAQSAPPAVREVPPLTIQNLGQATVPIDGPWAFHPGDDSTWADSSYDDSSWPRLETGRDWESQDFPNLTGFAWYRRHIALTGPTIPPDLSLLLSGVDDAAEVYWNGHLVGTAGKLPPGPVWHNPIAFGVSQLFWPYLIPLNASGTTGVLAIRVWKAPHLYYSFPNEGGLLATPRIGGHEAATGVVTAAHFAWLESSLYAIVLAAVSGLVALLAFLAWLRDRRQRMLLWVALFTAHPLLLFPIVGMPWFLTFRTSYGLIAPVVALQDVSLWFLLLYLLGLRGNTRLVRWTNVLAVICVLINCLDASLQLFDWTTWPAPLALTLDVTFTIPALLLQAYSVVLVTVAVRRRLDAARWFLAITAMLADLDFAFSNWFSLGDRWTHITWYPIFSAPLFSIGGNGFDPLIILNTILLAAILFAVWQYEAEQRQRQSVLDEEYRNAQELQQVLVPESLPDLPGYDVTSAYRPAQEVGGDFFQILLLPEGQALAVVGDVSGKGLKAAMTVSLIVGAVRSLAEATSDPAAILAGLNRRLHARLQTGFATCVAVRLDTDGHCLIANAGHLAPYLNGQELGLPPALPLGLTEEAAYDTTSLHLGAGDRLTLYTDGLPEARSATGELYGFDRLKGLMAEHPDAHQAIEAAVHFGQEDDLTVLTLTRAGAREPAIAKMAVASN